MPTAIGYAEALRAFGCDPDAIADAARRADDVLGYVEVHIEQGPVLEAEDLPVGIVTAHQRRVPVHHARSPAYADHAGTVPMHLRRDALAAAAEMVLAVERRGLRVPRIVATVGMMEALPGAVNVIPGGRCRSTCAVPATICAGMPSPGSSGSSTRSPERRGLSVAGHAALRRTRRHLRAVAGRSDGSSRASAAASGPCGLPSGAGHDGMAMIGAVPHRHAVHPLPGGVSHNPAEAITAQDADAAIRVLTDFLRHLTPPQ